MDEHQNTPFIVNTDGDGEALAGMLAKMGVRGGLTALCAPLFAAPVLIPLWFIQVVAGILSIWITFIFTLSFILMPLIFGIWSNVIAGKALDAKLTNIATCPINELATGVSYLSQLQFVQIGIAGGFAVYSFALTYCQCICVPPIGLIFLILVVLGFLLSFSTTIIMDLVVYINVFTKFSDVGSCSGLTGAAADHFSQLKTYLTVHLIFAILGIIRSAPAMVFVLIFMTIFCLVILGSPILFCLGVCFCALVCIASCSSGAAGVLDDD